MTFQFSQLESYKFVDTGGDPEQIPIVLLHGLLGNPEGWADTVDALAAHDYRVIVPLIPIDRMPLAQANVTGIVRYVRQFTNTLELETAVLVGNSLGGQIALHYVLLYPESVVGLILSGSSGVYEMEVGKTTFRRRDRSYIRTKAEKSFYDPVHVTDELVESLYKLANDRARALRIVRIARSSITECLTDRLESIDVPTALIWGTDDQITPPDVAITFKSSMPCAELHFIERCGHAPMMERPDIFNELSLDFLQRVVGATALPAPSV